MIEYGIIPSLQIIDGFEKRQKREFPKLGNASELIIDNPAAEITLQSIEIIKKAFTMNSPPYSHHVILTLPIKTMQSIFYLNPYTLTVLLLKRQKNF